MDKTARRTIDGREVWRWNDIMDNGSEELQEIISIITQGHRPGIPYRESDKDE